ncbi:MAG TPA: RiPP maturation radical SAM C-methyltransferase [Thermoanaerobaculia bacterium]|nr:RiPP maturation radical SAM C-methyltransferase [Thermoanaerobaculia bacterium]
MQSAEALYCEPPFELPRLDLASLRSLLGPAGPRLVLARHRAGLLTHPRVARGLEELDPSFHFWHKGDLYGMTPSVNKALARAGVRSNKAREAVAAEAVHLARTFAGLTGDLEPRVWIGRGGPGAAEPLPPGTRLALAFSLGCEARLPHVGRLPPDTAAVLRLDPLAEIAVPLPAAEPGRGAPLVLWLSSERAPADDLEESLLPGADHGPVEVVLASMPFGTLDQPSLALSLLKSAIAPVPARALYFAFPFARRIGAGLYFWLSEHQPFFSALLGEWLFRGALFDGPEELDVYVKEVLLKYTDRWRLSADDDPTFSNLVPETLVDELLRIRAGVGEFVDACAEEVLSHRPKVVGLTSVFQQHVATLALARRLKERAPDVAVVLGGANCEGAMGVATARCFGFLDAVVSGEADVVFPLLVERLLGGLPVADLPGVYTPLSPEVPARPANAPSPRHMDDLPLPDCGDYFLQFEGSGLAESLKPRLPFETSRGCWWGEKQHCTFCGLNGATMTFRSKSAERALDELRTLTRRHPGLFVSVTDNILDMRYLKTFLPRLREEGIRAELFYEVKSNLKKEDVRQLRDAGIVEIQPGIESLSDEVLRLMRKGVRGLQNIQLLKWCKELGIWPLWNLIWGFPGEPPEDYARMAALMPLLHHLPPPSGMSPICLERFSPNFDRSHEMGFEDVRPVDAYSHVYPFAPADLADLAYFFQCRHRDGRDVASYTRPVAQRIVEWREAYGECDLVAVDRGDHLLVCDTRAVAVQPLSILEGLGRALLLACDSMTTVGHLRQTAAAAAGTEISRGEVEDALAPLLARGFLIREGDSVLALTVPGTLAGPSAGEAN